MSLDLETKRHEIMALGHESGLATAEALFPEGTIGATADRESDGTWSVGPLASIALPIFNFGQATNTASRARLARAYGEYTDLAIRVRHLARSSFVETSSTLATARYLKDVMLPLRRRMTQETQQRFNAMQIGIFDLLDAKNAELEVERRLLDATLKHWRARHQRRTLMTSRRNFLVAPPRWAPRPPCHSLWMHAAGPSASLDFQDATTCRSSFPAGSSWSTGSSTASRSFISAPGKSSTSSLPG
ncbi:MAG: TolC family protein [Salinibacterium sp.]|nr:TolC family protein [Salinibacterium sp.]